MKNPQTTAIALSKFFPDRKLISIAKYGCCAFSVLWSMGIKCDDVDAIIMVADMMEQRAIDVDCTVYWKNCTEYLNKKYIKIESEKISDIKDIKGKAIVNYRNGIKNHWVGVENGKIAFNSLDYSNCVTYGKPCELRRIIWSD